MSVAAVTLTGHTELVHVCWVQYVCMFNRCIYTYDENLPNPGDLENKADVKLITFNNRTCCRATWV